MSGDANLTIAIDFDDTWTADMLSFLHLAFFLKGRGHTVIIATARAPGAGNVDRVDMQVPPDIPRVYCDGQPKGRKCQEAGYNVDIWIDDCPGSIWPQGWLHDALARSDCDVATCEVCCKPVPRQAVAQAITCKECGSG